MTRRRLLTLTALTAIFAILSFAQSSDAQAGTIASGASLSGQIALGHFTPAAIEMPTAWTAAVITFQVSTDGTTYKNLYDEFGSEIQITVAASRFIRLNPADWWGARYLKLRSGTSASPVNQTAARTLNIIVR